MGKKKDDIVDLALFDRARESTDGATGKLTRTQTLKRTPAQTPRRINSRTDGQTVEQAVTHTVEQAVTHSVEHSDRHPKRHSDPYIGLSGKQKLILAYLVEREDGVVSLKEMEQDLSIPYGTIRGSIRILHNKKFITKPTLYRNGLFQGIRYRITENARRHSDEHSDSRTHGQTLAQTLCFISSSSFLKETTTIESVISTSPDLRYWHEKGLTAKQFNTWLDTAQCGPETLTQYLAWFAFDATENGIEESKKILNVFNWFFRILKKSGAYPKPGNFKSHTDRMLAQERELVEQEAAKLKELQQLREQKAQIVIDTEYETMISDPECELYQECLKALNKYQRKGKAFDEAMKRAFVEKHEKRL
jgi:hypothetical protein